MSEQVSLCVTLEKSPESKALKTNENPLARPSTAFRIVSVEMTVQEFVVLYFYQGLYHKVFKPLAQ